MRSVISTFLIVVGGSANGAELIKSADTRTETKVGIGASFSEVSGVSVYIEADADNFFQGTLGFANYGNYAATGDYAFAFRNVISKLPSVTPYCGLGAVLWRDESAPVSRNSPEEYEATTNVGARIPFGVNFEIPKTPVQLSAELAPSLLFDPENRSYLQGGFSARVLF